ncbi:hypothetical protein D3C85_1242200 [compost metagenome]
MLFDLVLEQDIDRRSAIRCLRQYPAAFARDDVGVKRHHFSPGDERKPGQPGASHAVTQMQCLKIIVTNKPVHPSHLCSAKRVGFCIVFKDQHSLPTFSQRHGGERLMRFIAAPDGVITALRDVELNGVGKVSRDGLPKEFASILALIQ